MAMLVPHSQRKREQVHSWEKVTRWKKQYRINQDHWRFFSFDYSDHENSKGLLSPGTTVQHVICTNTPQSNPIRDYVMLVTDSKILQFERAELIIKFNDSVVAEFISLRWLLNRKVLCTEYSGVSLTLRFQYNFVDLYLKHEARSLYHQFSEILTLEISNFIGRFCGISLEIAFHYDIALHEWFQPERAWEEIENQENEWERELNNRMYSRRLDTLV